MQKHTKNKKINLIVELPDNCAYLNSLKNKIKMNLKGTAKLKSIQLICNRDKMLAEVVFSAEKNLIMKAEMLIFGVISNHHPLKEGEKLKVKSLLPNNRFQVMIFERKNNKLTAHILAGPKGKKEKAHIFKEPKRPQRYEVSSQHLDPSEAYGNKGEYYISVSDAKRDFHACIQIKAV